MADNLPAILAILNDFSNPELEGTVDDMTDRIDAACHTAEDTAVFIACVSAATAWLVGQHMHLEDTPDGSFFGLKLPTKPDPAYQAAGQMLVAYLNNDRSTAITIGNSTVRQGPKPATELVGAVLSIYRSVALAEEAHRG